MTETKVFSKAYSRFGGVDFSPDSVSISDARAAEAVNIIRDAGGYPEKRIGWRVVNRFDGRINQIKYARLIKNYGAENTGGAEYVNIFLVHAGRKLFAVTSCRELRPVIAADRDKTFNNADRSTISGAANASEILRYLAGFSPIDGGTWQNWQIENMDETGDGVINGEDAQLLSQWQVYLIDSGGIRKTEIYSGVANERSVSFEHEGALYFLDGEHYLKITLTNANTYSVENVEDVAYVPTVNVGAYYYYPEDVENPVGIWTDGQEYEEGNLLTAKRIVTMAADGVNTDYWLHKNKLHVIKVELYTSPDDGWTETTAYQVTEDSTNYKTKIHFTGDAPAAHPDGAGIDNIRVTCVPWQADTKTGTVNAAKTIDLPQGYISVVSLMVGEATISSYTVADGVLTITDGTVTEGASYALITNIECNNESARIKGCTISTRFGYFNDNRYFFSGNRLLPNRDWQSGLDDPTYFPEHGWVDVGSPACAIMGYVPVGDAMAIVKADDNQDAGVYMRTAIVTDDSQILFPVQQGNMGVGAVSKYGMQSLRGDALFFSKDGVFEITLQDISQFTAVNSRSAFVDPKLRNENVKKEAVSVIWGDYYILCTPDGNCYVADYVQKSNGQYEWFYWTNIPARVFCEHDGELWFGTEDGRLCKFNTDRNDLAKFNDNSEAGQSDGEAIIARWVTKADTLGTIATKKTLTRKGCTVMVKPYSRSSIEITAKTDSRGEACVDSVVDAISDMTDETGFDSNFIPRVISFDHRIKRFTTLQLEFKNDRINEGFGIYGIQLQYTNGNYAK